MPTTVRLPVLPLRDIVAFPLMTLPLLVGRSRSLATCTAAQAGDRRILLVAQRDATTEHPAAGDLHGLGVIAVLEQHLPLPDSRLKLLVRGERRAKLVRLTDDDMCLMADAEAIDDLEPEMEPADLPGFSLADWKTDGARASVADLQRLLEDETLGPAERLHAASQLLHG